MELRPYQTKIIEDARALMRQGVMSIQIQSSTGSGKTVLAAFMVKSAVERGGRVFWLTHRTELLRQVFKTFNDVVISSGIIASGWMEEPNLPVQICSVQSLTRRLHKYKKPTIVFVDESHHQAAQSYKRIHDAYNDAFFVGLSATPERTDGQGLGKYFSKLVCGPTTKWLIQNGHLADYKLYAPSNVDVSAVHLRGGDYASEELNKVMDRPTITGNAVDKYIQFCAGKRALVFSASVEHSKHVVSEFLSRGISAVHIDGETPTEERLSKMKDFSDGKNLVVSNYGLFSEGVDVPVLESVIMLRPTMSKGLYLQMVGRALRPSPGKGYAIILDQVGNCERHGMPDHEHRWSLAGHSARSGSSAQEVKVKCCPKCFAMQPPGNRCRYCGYLFPMNDRATSIKQVEGELVEVKKIDRPFVPQWAAQSEADLVEVGRQRGYNNPEAWAHHVYDARQKKLNLTANKM